jgi:hypothetical protein
MRDSSGTEAVAVSSVAPPPASAPTRGSRLAATLDDLRMGARFLLEIPGFLRRPVREPAARAALARRLAARETAFLSLARQAVYANARSPYRALLQQAGCEYGDLEALVRRDGLEATLRSLFRHGVYLTVDELKGRRAVVRGSTALTVDSRGLRSPIARASVPARTGGSRSAGSAAPLALEFVRVQAEDLALLMNARGGFGWRCATWAVPGGTGILFVLLCAAATGRAPERWFSPVNPRDGRLHARYRWSARALAGMAWATGHAMPAPEHAPLDGPDPVAMWMAGVLREGATPHLWTSSSAAVRLVLRAQALGLSLAGARFLLSMEPVTAARVATLRAAGAEALPTFGSMDTGGPIGLGCLQPAAPDDVHLLHDLHAAIQVGPEPGPLPPGALLLSTLSPAAPVLLLNVSLGDRAVMAARRCGCPLETLGWPTHLDAIRSFEKLTAAGMTFADGDVVRVLEEVLPARFGGGPSDYQLVEADGAAGGTLRLLVHPRLGALDSQRIIEVFLAAIGPGSGAERVMSLTWREGGLVGVERRPPVATASGKILHLHVERCPP